MNKPRAIFEEVSDAAPAPAAPKPGEAEARRRRARRRSAFWLNLLAVLVTAMVLVGGLTRLTDSGLSITEWNVVSGALPPMTAEAWQEEFDKYRAIPEYQLQNRGMSLSEFQYIYWWEWGHRQFGRLIGLVWAIGFLALAVTRNIPPGWTGRFLLLGALGGAQGAIGWWMVASGLTGERVDVASYRLATHLGLAFVILGLLLHYGFQLRRDAPELLQARRRRLSGPRLFGQAVLGLAFVQILLGALVAGIDAGRGYIDWPRMGGEWIPSEALAYLPLWTNFFENPALVQFNHRVVGYALLLLGVGWWVRCLRQPHKGARGWTGVVALMLIAQSAVGVATVLNAAPLHWAILHQAGALLLWALTLRALFETGWPREERIERSTVRTR